MSFLNPTTPFKFALRAIGAALLLTSSTTSVSTLSFCQGRSFFPHWMRFPSNTASGYYCYTSQQGLMDAITAILVKHDQGLNTTDTYPGPKTDALFRKLWEIYSSTAVSNCRAGESGDRDSRETRWRNAIEGIDMKTIYVGSGDTRAEMDRKKVKARR